ncbi:LysE family translocator [Pontivivens insulae]|uniref:Homoserine/homoserine lactone efflux protein n=1 Tax=Pontivivens insulae TaxID=1639689 RepID=A0A2R8AC60_9RHOB|nr:LysE family translocator [Pontivivens insulae]RED11189.1 threonine/homoserine/homoserine lactone efflux protein [Pontivivens insulae]SPF29638.1 Homoserine/homoserine lactone efflux protein [Pontivivens insulae]
MAFEIWLAFAIASAVLVAIPGPTVVLVVSCALGSGKRSALYTVPGVALGDLVAMVISLAGAGAVLAASATAFTVLKVVGALYLIWMGWGLLKAKPTSIDATPMPGKRLFRDSFLVTVLNPKGIVFFIAFVPQFIDTTAPLLPQTTLLVATFVALGGLNAALWALAAGTMRDRLAGPRAQRVIARTGGVFLILAGLVTALTRRVA